MDKQWLICNLEDAQAELARAVEEIATLESSDELVAQQLIAEVYLKLNFAWNARGGVRNKLATREDYYRSISYPKIMDIYAGGASKEEI